MKKALLAFGLTALLGISVNAQGVREVKTSPQKQQPAEAAQTAMPKPAPAPNSFQAKYEGGLFGFSEKIEGTLNFDETNERIVFRNKANKEVFAFPYKSLLVIYPDSKSSRPTAATVGSVIPVPGAGLLGLIKTKKPYLIMQFDDPRADVKGAVSFKLQNKELLRSVIFSLGEKAEMKQRGDAFYRPRQAPATQIL
jgi:hypothetical protein